MAAEASTRTDYPLPAYVYKILPAPPPDPLPAALPLSALDRHDGFVHLSTAAQAPRTAALFFADSTALALLKVDTAATARAGGVYRWVDGAPGCPHLFARAERGSVALGSGNVRGWREVRRAEGQGWEDAFRGLAEDGWLADE
ncbi:hypothetical protein BD413DRAFT_483724 [Trametes elegans]|nr:hypothetical protein BD413DRAFT_483724 [Trametes elegans]